MNGKCKWKGYNKKTKRFRKHPKFNVPVIGHFEKKSIRYNSIIEAEADTGIPYHMIFDACINRIYGTEGIRWEYENGKHWIKYHAKRVRGQKALRLVGFNG